MCKNLKHNAISSVTFRRNKIKNVLVEFQLSYYRFVIPNVILNSHIFQTKCQFLLLGFLDM